MGYILVADDDENIALLLRRKLEMEGFQVRTAANGVQVLERCQAEKPDLILMDVAMPVKNGLDATREVKALFGEAAPAILLVTALGRRSDVEEGMLAGADDYIIKPFSPQVLMEKVRQHLPQG